MRNNTTLPTEQSSNVDILSQSVATQHHRLATNADIAGFSRQLSLLYRQEIGALGPADLVHLLQIVRLGRIATLFGYIFAWIAPNPLSAVLIAMGLSIRWMLMHHISHGGYDLVPSVPPQFTNALFARGWRRFVDWFDWIHPEAWRLEHNALHHANTGQEADPDILERNLDFIRNSTWSLPKRYFALAVLALTWKLGYYAPTTLRALNKARRGQSPTYQSLQWRDFFDVRDSIVRSLWARCILPYGFVRFLIIPAFFIPLGSWAVLSVLVNIVFAEIITNVHTFLVVAPNHTGEDLYRFAYKPRSRAEFCFQQVVGTANYSTGGFWNDLAHLWLNYQIEHHLWPNLPMSSYQRVQPKIILLCSQFGIPYVQENVWRRIQKTLNVCVGKASMQILDESKSGMSVDYSRAQVATMACPLETEPGVMRV